MLATDLYRSSSELLFPTLTRIISYTILIDILQDIRIHTYKVQVLVSQQYDDISKCCSGRCVLDCNTASTKLLGVLRKGQGQEP